MPEAGSPEHDDNRVITLEDLGIGPDGSSSESDEEEEEEEEKNLMDDSALYDTSNHDQVKGPHITFQAAKLVQLESISESIEETPRNSLNYKKTPSYSCEDVDVKFDPRRTTQKPDLARSNSFSYPEEEIEKKDDESEKSSPGDVGMTPSRRKNRESVPPKIHSTKRESNIYSISSKF